MQRLLRLVLIVLYAIVLTACTMSEERFNYSYQNYMYDESQLYPKVDYYNPYYQYQPQAANGQVQVPESYHVGAYHSPASFKDRDRHWVTSQNPQAYTIEVADGEKASQVAKKLYNTPKNDRMAEVKYSRQGKTYYRGVYGSYDNEQSAHKALNELPPDIRKGAAVKSWGGVQEDLVE
jgi:septal ring-binding cell division protein DamX